MQRNVRAKVGTGKAFWDCRRNKLIVLSRGGDCKRMVVTPLGVAALEDEDGSRSLTVGIEHGALEFSNIFCHKPPFIDPGSFRQ